ncbi:MAG: hypothetical protein IT270_10030 [Saprospiraceae bacterium]|nr:hypothetical protein [Saprospiraceae bacterium]
MIDEIRYLIFEISIGLKGIKDLIIFNPKQMKSCFSIFILIISCLVSGKSQSHFSLVFEKTDTLLPQSLIVRTDAQSIVAVQDMFVAGPVTYANRILRTTVFDHQGQLQESFLLDSTQFQVTQMIRRQTVLRTANAWIVSADQTYNFGSDPQSCQAWIINPNTWEIQLLDFQEPNFVSVSGALLPGIDSQETYCFYTSSDNTDNQEYLHVVLFRDDGMVQLDKKISLPLPLSRIYYNVNSAIRSQSGLEAVLSYEIIPSLEQRMISIRLTPDGTLLDIHEFDPSTQAVFYPRAEQQITDTLHSVFKTTDLSSFCYKAFHADSPNSTLFQTCLDDALQASYSIGDGIQDENGRFYLIGTTEELYSRSFVAHIDTDGTPLWVKQYFCDYLDNDNRTIVESIDLLEDDRLAIFGVVKNNPTSIYSAWQEWLFTLGRDGCYNGACGDSILVASQTLGSSAATPQDGFSLYPNPARETVTVKYEGPLPDGTRFSLYASDGRLVVEQELGQDATVSIPASAPAGFAFWMVYSSEGVLGSGKLVLEK